jgi:PAS domain S-box-containing protein
VVGLDGVVRWIDPTVGDTLGTPETDWLDRPLTRLAHADDVSALTSFFDRLRQGLPGTGLAVRLRSHSGYRRLRLSARADLEAGVVYATAVDVTPTDDPIAPLRLIADALPAALIYVDTDQRYRFVNETTRRWFGTDPVAAGLTMRDLLGEVVYETRRPAIERALQGERVTMEGPTRVAGGGIIESEVVYQPDVDGDGQVRGFVGMIHDITDRVAARRAIEQSESSLRRFIQTANEGILRVGPDERVVYANDYHCRLLGYEPGETVGMHVLDFVFPEDLPEMAARRSRRRGEAPRDRYEMRLRHRDGTEVWVLNSTVVVEEGGQYDGTYTMITDITELKQVERALRESEGRYRELANAMPLIVWTARPDGATDYFNDRWYEFTGFDRTLEGDASWGPILHPDDVARTLATWYASVQSGEMYEIEYRFYDRRTGGYRWHLSRALPSRDEDGTIVKWYGSTTDIHERKTHEQILDFLVRLGEVVGHIGDPDIAIGIASRMLGEEMKVDRVTYADVMEDENRFSIPNDYGRDLPSMAGDYRISDFGEERLQRLRAGETVAIDDLAQADMTEAEKARNDALGLRAMITVPLLRDGSLVGALGVHQRYPRAWTAEEIRLAQIVAERTRDILEQIRANRRIRELNEALEERVRLRTAELERANREMEGFTYSVSHDLRAPLRGIVSTSRLLEEDFGEVLPDEAKNLLRRQANAANRLATLIDELLQLSRISRTDIRREEVDLTALAHEVIAELTRDRSFPATFDVRPGLRAHGDSRLLRLILVNLVENALKFSPNGGVITVSEGRHEGRYGFFVRDQGIGFDPRYEAKLWLPFERLHRDEDFPGTGIGLANVRRIAERHGGTTWADSRPGQGATFWFNLGR